MYKIMKYIPVSHNGSKLIRLFRLCGLKNLWGKFVLPLGAREG
jgi:hypothetical protein